MGSRRNGGFNASYPLPKDTADQGTPNEGGLKCELKTFESRYNWKGEKVIVSVGSRKNMFAPNHVAPDSALVLTRFYTTEAEVDHTELEIRSPHLKKAFKEVVPEYRNLDVQTKSIMLRDDVRYFFYYRTELQEYSRNLEDHTAIEHLTFALNYMYRTLESELHTYENFVEAPLTLPSIDFLNLWMVFRPGDYYYTNFSGIERVTKIRQISRSELLIDVFKWKISGFKWTIHGEGISYDGRNFGYASSSVTIKPYDGCKPLINLIAKPLNYHPDKESIIARMVQRGKKYTSLHGIHHREYDGTAEVLGANRMFTSEGEEDEFLLQSTTVGQEETSG